MTEPGESTPTLTIASSRGPYPVHLGDGLLGRSWELLGPLLESRPVVILSQRRIRRLHGERLLASWPAGRPAPLWIEVPQGEKAKTLGWLQRVASRLAAAARPRSTVLLAFGGGVVGDLGGFVAATYMRGLDWVQVPTTVLAQVDSSVGGKVAVNLPQGKNLVGAFYPPNQVLMDPAVLGTLPRRELLAGQVEMVKIALLQDAAFFARLREELPDPPDWVPLLRGAVAAKAAVVAADEREAGLRMGLNLGHTMGHALEAAGGYRRWVHGEAVALGIRYAYRLARRLGTVGDAEVAAVDAVLVGKGLAPPVPRLPFRGLAARLTRDKKADASGVRWVLPTGIGSWRLEPGIPAATLEETWKELQDG